ncbi:MAG: enolase C-terminal domain-like protein [Nanopusillaceae archaeon]
MEIKSAKARIVLNSRGNPTIEVEINGYHESAPEGASKGKYEVKYLEPEKAVKLFNEELVDFLKTFDIQSFDDLKDFEAEFETIGGIEKYGANTLLATEYAILRAWSAYQGRPIYEFFKKKPRMNMRILANVVGGGAHAKGRSTDIQEFLVSPDTNSIKLSIFIASYVHKLLGEKLSLLDDKFTFGKNDEGAWTTTLPEETVLEILRIIEDDIRNEYNVDLDFGLDFAASQLYKDGYYVYKNKKLPKEDQINYVLYLATNYNLFYVEDPLHEDDFIGFAEINNKTPAIITGDDLTVTNISRIKKAIDLGSVKGVIIKPNQIGSIVKTYEAIMLCKENNIYPILSHRSGETESNIIAHLAVGFEVPFVKFGIVNGERIAKLNELIRIEEKLYGK